MPRFRHSLLLVSCALFTACANKGGGDNRNNNSNNNNVGVMVHNRTQCPDLLGDYTSTTDSSVVKISRNSDGDLVLALDKSEPIIINGAAQTSKDGKTIFRGACSVNTVLLTGLPAKSGGTSGNIRPMKTGFILDRLTWGGKYSTEFTKVASPAGPAPSPTPAQRALADVETKLTLTVKNQHQQDSAAFNFQFGKFIGSQTPADGASCIILPNQDVLVQKAVSNFTLSNGKYTVNGDSTINRDSSKWHYFFISNDQAGAFNGGTFNCTFHKNGQNLRDLTLPEAQAAFGDEVTIEIRQ